MLAQYIPILLVILGYLLYHSSQKLVPMGVNAFFSLIVSYTVALILCIALFFLVPAREGMRESFKSLNWTSFAIGLAVVALEGGFLFAYRAGWNVSFTGLISNVAAALLLLPIGIFLFREQVSALNLLGVVLAITGIILIKLK